MIDIKLYTEPWCLTHSVTAIKTLNDGVLGTERRYLEHPNLVCGAPSGGIHRTDHDSVNYIFPWCSRP